MFPNQENVAWWGNFAFPLAMKYGTEIPKWMFDGTFSQKDGGMEGGGGLIKKLNILPLPQ